MSSLNGLQPSLSAEAARAAALQAEFNERKWVWVPDEKEGYLAGWVNQEDQETAEIVMSSGGEIRRVPLYALSKMNPPKFDRVDDIADLTFLNEASVVHNLRLRYGSGAIYTYSGLFLVAINPYQNLPLYTDAIIQQYRNKRRDENPPHIFAVTERAWINMQEERENQSILITGESGAGKTESTKKVIQYLSAIATDAHLPTSSHTHSPSMSSSFSTIPSVGLPRSRTKSISTNGTGNAMTAKERLGLLERQIIQANPILEAFGNAQTQRNNNSSRFGKFIRISFAPDGSISGANIDWYLLEKSRVVVRSPAERNFHVFYQLMSAGGPLKDSLLLDGNIEDYEFLNRSRREIDGVNDRDDWDTLINAFEIVGFSQAEQFDLFRIVAAVLHIGNIAITSTRADDAFMADPSQAERVCHLLGIPMAEFTKAVLRPKVLAGREWVTQARTGQQALDELAALSKTLYEKSFGALVDRINRALDRPTPKSTFIGVLDIAGFEIFEINTYEQLLINFTNEKLQQFFNHHMFVLEQEEYSREGIEWDYVNFKLDLQPTIDLIEGGGNVIGILSCLDEECIMPKATDLTFTEKVHSLWSGEIPPTEQPHPGRAKYSLPKFEQGFIITHYAGKVEYRTDGWLEKNKDPLNDNLTRVLSASTQPYVASLFQDYVGPLADLPSTSVGFSMGKKRGVKKGAFRTVAQRHKEQLRLLMTQLHATQPHFVRCIVPNNNKKPGRVDVPLVLDQLRCNGVLEGIRIARLGYPNRLPFVEFRQRYEIMTPGIIPRGYMDGRKACLRMVESLELDTELYRVGTSKIFFKAGVLAELEERRDALLYDVFSRLQAVARKFSARRQMKKILNRAIAIRTIQRNARVYGELRDWPWWQLYSKVRPLLAATRNDEELRRKEVELQLIKERAERDQREKENLENMKMALEAEKQKIVKELEAERALTVDKDSLLERSKQRESELEEEIVALHADLDVLDSQLDRALIRQKETDEKHENLRQAFDQAAEHLVRLESEQNEWKRKEVEYTDLFSAMESRLAQLQGERDELQKLTEDFKTLMSQRDEEFARFKERSEASASELQSKLTVEIRNSELLNSKVQQLEKSWRQSKDQVAEVTRTANDRAAVIQKKDEDLIRLNAKAEQLETSSRQAMEQFAELTRTANDYSAMVKRKEEDIIRLNAQVEQSEKSSRQAKDQLAELSRTANDYVAKLQKKEEDVVRLASDVTALKRERTQLVLDQDRLAKMDAALKKALTELKNKEWEIKQLESRQDKKIVEHVHVLEKAKKVTDQQLKDTQEELQKNVGYIRSLEKAKKALEEALQTTGLKLRELEQQIEEGDRGSSEVHRQRLLQQLQEERLQHQKALAERDLANDQTRKRFQAELAQITEQQLKETQEELAKNAVYILSLEKSKKGLEEALQTTARKLQELERELDEEDRGSSELGIHRHRLAQQLQDERLQHQKDLAERDFTNDQTRKKYQAELAQLSEELQSQRDTMTRLREDNRKIHSDYDELQLRFDEEVHNSGAWKRDKERMETKIADLTKAYETSTAVQSDQQTQIVSLQSQVRELRSVLNDAEADRAMLQKARRSLQAELEGIKLDHMDASKVSSDREVQKLRLQKQDLERSLEEQEDRVSVAFGRMKAAETHAAESQLELDKIRLENTELDRKNAQLEKQVKELNVRIVDLETKSYTTTPQPNATIRQLQARVEDLTAQLNQVTNDRRQSTSLRSSDKAVRDLQMQLQENERQRAKLEEDRKASEAQIQSLRQTLDQAHSNESELVRANRRLELQAAEAKQATLTLEREVERLRSRISRPASSVISDAATSISSGSSSVGSPRKLKQ